MFDFREIKQNAMANKNEKARERGKKSELKKCFNYSFESIMPSCPIANTASDSGNEGLS